MTIDEAEDILEEITRGGLPSNVRVEAVADRAEHIATAPSDSALEDAQPTIVDELAAVAQVPADAVAPRAETPERPKPCGAQYVQNGRAYPDFCSLPAGHPPKSATTNHYAGTIGWFA